MKSFDEFQFNKNVQTLKEEILKIASGLPDKIVQESVGYLFEDDAPFPQQSWAGNVGNNIKTAYNAFQNQRQISNTDNPVGNGYNNLSKSLDNFIGAIQQHPVGKNQSQLLQTLKGFKNNLSQQGADLSQQMKQFNQTNAVQRASNGTMGSNGTPLQNAGSGTAPVAGQPKQLDQNDVVQHLKDKGFTPQDIRYYMSKMKNTSSQPNQQDNTPIGVS